MVATSTSTSLPASFANASFGIATSSLLTVNTLSVQNSSTGKNVIGLYSNAGSSLFSIADSGAIDTALTAGLLTSDSSGVISANAYGTNGYILQTTGSGVQWVATSSLGLGNISGSGTSGQVAYFNGANSLTSNSAFTFDGTKLTATYASTTAFTVAGQSYLVGTSTFAGGNFVVNADGSLFSSSRGVFNALFAGDSAGLNASSAAYSIFLGSSAGNAATGAAYSVFLGYSAGSGATGALTSNFIGRNSGIGASNAGNSNFMGYYSGSGATNAGSSNFFGNQAGRNAVDAANSIFIASLADSAQRARPIPSSSAVPPVMALQMRRIPSSSARALGPATP